MALRFNRSKDGAVRATVRVAFRAELESVAYALALDLGYPSDPDAAAAERSKARIEELVRSAFYVHGPPVQWPENSDHEWEACLAAAERRVRELWPEGVA